MSDDTSDEEKLMFEIMLENGMVPVGQFKPVIFYNPSLDWIEVHVADCSILELAITDMLSVHKDSHQEDRVVGFHVECARRFCRTFGLPDQGIVRVSDILQRLSKVDERTAEAIKEIALPLLHEYELDEVELPVPAA